MVDMCARHGNPSAVDALYPPTVITSKVIIQKPNRMGLSKTLSRLMLVQALYVLDINGMPLSDADTALEFVREFYLDENEITLQQINIGFVHKVLTLLMKNLYEIDFTITTATNKGKDIESMSYLLRAILRSGTCEILYLDTPKKVIISEYVDLAAEFCAPKEVAFVNAVLDKIVKQQAA
jgi:N utilization substance protein B